MLEHVVTTPLPVRMPLQATGQSEKLIVQPCWRAILAQQPLMAAAVSPPGCAILTHRLCYRADKVRQSEFLLPGWRSRIRLGPHKDKVRRNTHAARQPHLGSHAAPETRPLTKAR